MTRDGLVEVNETQQTAERISKRTQDADFQKSLEQQAAQDAAQLQGAASPTSPLPHAPGAAPKADTGKTERVMEHIEAAHTRKASKKAVRKAQAEATAGTKSSRLHFTDEERAAPELEKYIKKSDKAADRLDKAKAAIPKEKKLVKERTFDETTGKGKTRLHFEEKDKPPGFKEKHNPLSRPTQEAGILVHNKIHSVEKDNSGVEGAHKTEEAAERGVKFGARKIKQGYRSHKLKPYREAAKAEKAAFRANVDFQYHKTLHENPQLIAETLERLRSSLIMLQYRLLVNNKQVDTWKRQVNYYRPILQDYHAVTQQLADKKSEQEQLQTTRNTASLLQIAQRRQLAEQIAALTEKIEELRSRQAMILHNLDCKNNGEAQRFGSYLDKLEEMQEKLAAQRESLTQQLSATIKQYLEIENMIQPEDEDSVRQRRTALRPDVAFEREQQLSHNGYIDNISIQIAQQIVDVQIVGDKISEKVQTSMAQHKEVPDR